MNAIDNILLYVTRDGLFAYDLNIKTHIWKNEKINNSFTIW